MTTKNKKPYLAHLLATATLLGSLNPWAHADEKPLYICQSGHRAVYTTQPKGKCQPAQIGGEATDSAALDNQEIDAIQQLWYQTEFGNVNENIAIIPPPRAIPSAPRAPSTVVATPPPPLTPKQMVMRDIANEQKALRSAENQLQQARQRGNDAKMRQLAATVVDRQQNIRALQIELKRY